MTIDEAIKELANYTYGNEPIVDETGRKAIMLGIEALKRTEQRREYLNWKLEPLLPSETID